MKLKLEEGYTKCCCCLDHYHFQCNFLLRQALDPEFLPKLNTITQLFLERQVIEYPKIEKDTKKISKTQK